MQRPIQPIRCGVREENPREQQYRRREEAKWFHTNVAKGREAVLLYLAKRVRPGLGKEEGDENGTRYKVNYIDIALLSPHFP